MLIDCVIAGVGDETPSTVSPPELLTTKVTEPVQPANFALAVFDAKVFRLPAASEKLLLATWTDRNPIELGVTVAVYESPDPLIVAVALTKIRSAAENSA